MGQTMEMLKYRIKYCECSTYACILRGKLVENRQAHVLLDA